MTKPSSTNLSPCVCGEPAHGITCQPFFGKYSIECCFCGCGVRHNTKRGVRNLWNAANRRRSIANLDRAWQRIYDLFEKPNNHAHDEALFDVNHGIKTGIHWALSEIEKLGGMDPLKRSKE